MTETRHEVQSEAHLPLSGITVIDCTRARAGPTCVRHLADWGATIIRVEQPEEPTEDYTGRREGFDFQNLHRNKRMIRLDLKQPEGLAAFMKLVEKADVIVENMRSAVKHRLKIAYDDVRKVNPKIVYASISGFGQSGPYGKRAGVDQIVQGMGGLMSITGLPGQGPVRVGIAIADLTAGNLLALATMMALFDRTRTGVGRWVHTSLLESQVFLLDFQAARYLKDGEVAKQAGNDHPTGVPTGVFPSTDGHFNIAAASSRVWERLCDALGKPEWKTKSDWNTGSKRSADRKALNAAISEITKHKPAAHWVELLEEAGVPCGPINSIDQVFADPQVKHLGIATPMATTKHGKFDVVASPINFEGLTKEIRIPTGEAGQDTEEVLRGVGYSEAKLKELRDKRVI
ncbi:MAG TPA: CaiB/BaiF CoA-transferase family protein [Burkholderiales bacterium]|nr:CaiB/BaiF CoA-transferase family protein [Burkholderiales bacterium]